MSEPAPPAATPPDDWSYRLDRLLGAILLCTLAIIATVVVTGVVVVQRVEDAASLQEGWTAGEVASALADLESRVEDAAAPAPLPSPALAPARVAPRKADVGEAANLGDVRVAAGWQVRTVDPATAMTQASLELDDVRVTLTRPGSALSSVVFELRGADGSVVGTGWCYGPADSVADTRPAVWCQPFDVSGPPVTATVSAMIRS